MGISLEILKLRKRRIVGVFSLLPIFYKNRELVEKHLIYKTVVHYGQKQRTRQWETNTI